MKINCYCSQLRAATRRLGATYDAALAPLGINIAQYGLLSQIRQHQPVSLTALGRLVELERSTVGRNVQVLERMGLVISARGEADQREAGVRLTTQGEKVLSDAEPRWEACQQTLAEQLGPAGMAALKAIISGI